MKLKRKVSKEEKEASYQISKYLKTHEEMVSFILTYMGMMSIMLDFLAETYGVPKRMDELPERTKYAIAQAIFHYKILGEMIRGDINPEELIIRWMPIEDDAWKAPEKISDRMVFVVKELYLQLEKEGRI